MVNIQVSTLSFAQCYALEMPQMDFLVFCTNGELDWRGACFNKDLQICIEMGIAAFGGTE